MTKLFWLLVVVVTLLLVFDTCEARAASASLSKDTTCYGCFFAHESGVPAGLIDNYAQPRPDALVNADAHFIESRLTDKVDCSIVTLFEQAAKDTDPNRRLMADMALGMPDAGCPVNYRGLVAAAEDARLIHRPMEAAAIKAMSLDKFKPEFADVKIDTDLTPKPGATTMILGESTIVMKSGMRIGTQVERVVRDWFTGTTLWDFRATLNVNTILSYHEGAFVLKMLETNPSLTVTPLTGTIVARDPKTNLWFAPDEKGVFRFNVLDDKIEYPSTHSLGDVAWITDTHGISAIVSQALETNSQIVIGCGDSVGKAQGAYYLAQHGVDVIMPADRYAYLLLGYKGKGTLLPGAPVHVVGGETVVGNQPIKFSMKETFIVQTTDKDYPMQYYDTASRYFHRLAASIPINVVYVPVDATDELDRMYSIATDNDASVIGVRIFTWDEDVSLRRWLKLDPTHRAILFHSGLYPYAQGLFADFPTQVTFGDLKPRFE